MNRAAQFKSDIEQMRCTGKSRNGSLAASEELMRPKSAVTLSGFCKIGPAVMTFPPRFIVQWHT